MNLIENDVHRNGVQDPLLIPIHFNGDDASLSNDSNMLVPEWAMIELNGELVKPDSASPSNSNSSTTMNHGHEFDSTPCHDRYTHSIADANSFELGSIHFTKDKVCNLI
jgi:hypothetical protein